MRNVRILVVCGILLSAMAHAQVEPVDVDADGVVDEMDLCEDTPAGDMVDADGCSICPCEETVDGEDWASHESYVGCVAAAAKERRKAGMIRRKAMRTLVKQARATTCGDPSLTLCCTYAGDEDTVGKCRVMTVDRCDELWENSDYVEDMGPGSCTPNPCAY